MRQTTTCPMCGAEQRDPRPPEPLEREEERRTEGSMLLARTLNGTPWRVDRRVARPPDEDKSVRDWSDW